MTVFAEPRRLIELDYAPRAAIVPYHERQQRWACLVCHRRFGKSYGVIADQIKRGITIGRPEARLAYIAPYRGQAKDIAWSYLKRMSRPLWSEEPRESDLSVKLLNGAVIRLYGGDNPDAIRGGYFDDVVLDEFGDQRPTLWRDVVRPMLADRMGSATFIGTPKGKNEFYDIHLRSEKDHEWFHLFMPASKSGIIPQVELDAMLLEMGTDRYLQEMECSFESAVHGAVYGEELRRAQEENRIRPIQVERAVRVHTGWDLGVRDSTAIWFVQCVGTERRLIDYYESSGVGLDHYVQVLEEKKRSVKNPNGYLYGNHYFPHDIEVRELTSGKSRRATLEDDLGIEVTVVPQHNLLDGINVVRRALDHCFIDPDRAFGGLEAFRNYRREWNDRIKDWSREPLHNFASHGCDAARTFFVGHDEPMPERQEDRHRSRGGVEQSAWTV